MNTEQKSKLKGLAEGWQEAAEAKAKASTGWARVGWIVACIACAVAGYFLSGCTAHYTQSASGDIAFKTTIVQPEPYRK